MSNLAYMPFGVVVGAGDRVLGMFLSEFGPFPRERFWVPFGMCSATSSAPNRVIRLYWALLHGCTFDEFVVAYESSSLLALFQKYGSDPNLYPKGFPEVLPASPDIVPSAWWLKKWIAGETIAKQAFYDYRFPNCRLMVEYRALEENLVLRKCDMQRL